jgi:exodeoxyribonuclease V alpha subunit
LFTVRLQKYGNYDFFQNIQVISPTKKGMLGTKELNKALQERLNPNINNMPEKASMGAVFRAGDRVMQIKNNYDIYWEKEIFGKKEIGSGVFNGEIGTITKIDEREKQAEI